VPKLRRRRYSGGRGLLPPIDVQITAGSTGIAGTISSLMFLGDLVQYRIASGALEVIALDRPRPDLSVGQPVRWSVPPERCSH